MRPAGKLLIAATIGRNLYGKWKFHHLLSAVISVAILAITAAVMISILIVGGFYAIYLTFMQNGFAPLDALLFTGTIALLLTGGLIAIIKKRVRELKTMTSTPVGGAVDAFIDGFLAKPR